MAINSRRPILKPELSKKDDMILRTFNFISTEKLSVLVGMSVSSIVSRYEYLTRRS